MGVSKTTVQCWIVASTIHVHSNSLKPILTEENKLARLLMANHFSDPQDPTKYQDICDCIHLDNKTVTKEVYRELLISKLILAILEKWPRRDRMSRTIFIQQDSVKSHICEDNKEFNNALMEQDIDAKLYMQTLNSPDVNLLDLCFLEPFRASMMHCQRMKKI